MFKKYYLLSFLLIIVFVSVILFFVFVQNKKISKVCINENCFEVEIADSSKERGEGLMNKQGLPENSGMLFVFDQEAIHSFWMKNTLIALDIIWIDKDKEIIYIEKEAQPCKNNNCKSYGPDKESKYVLEINVGLTDKLKINVGDKVLINF